MLSSGSRTKASFIAAIERTGRRPSKTGNEEEEGPWDKRRGGVGKGLYRQRQYGPQYHHYSLQLPDAGRRDLLRPVRTSVAGPFHRVRSQPVLFDSRTFHSGPYRLGDAHHALARR